jgi:hypothetical protein
VATRLTIRLNLCLILAVGGVSLAFALYQTQNEMHGLRRELDRQSAVLAESLEKSAEPLVAARSYRDLQRLADRFKDHERLAGVAVYDAQAVSRLLSTPGWGADRLPRQGVGKVPTRHAGCDWPAVAERVREASSIALFLDFDGALAPW